MARKKITSLVSILAAGLVLLSCAFGDSEDVVPAVTGDDQAIYVAGRYNTHACLWILNGTIPARAMLPELFGTTESWAKGLSVTDRRVVASGCCYNGALYFPVLWIDGAVVSLTPSGYSTYSFNGESMTVYNGKIFVALSSNDIASVWANGTLSQLPLPPGATSSKGSSIAIENGHVIVGGSVTVGGWEHACAWVDGMCTVFDTTNTITEVNSVAWYGGHWYAAGYTVSYVPALWIDGMYVNVDPNPNGAVNALHVYDGMPYMSGSVSGPYATSWAGARQILTSVPSEANGIFVHDGGMQGKTVIVAGVARFTFTPFASAALWLNGSSVVLDSAGDSDDTDARAIAIGPKIWK